MLSLLHADGLWDGDWTQLHSCTDYTFLLHSAPCPHLALHTPADCLQIYFEARDWKQVQEYVQLLSKRRGQLKQAVQAMVRQAMGYIAQTPDQATRVELIKTLQTLTEGKVGALSCTQSPADRIQSRTYFPPWL